MRINRQEIEAALSLLLDQMEGEQGPNHEIYLRLVQILDAMRATGMPLPEDLVAMEREMAAEFEGETAARQPPASSPARAKTPPAGRRPK